MNLDSFDLKHWWKAVVAAGVALAVAAVAAKHSALLVVGLGLISCGVGEWINRPLQQTVVQQGVYGINGIISGHPWKASPLGLVLDVLGVGLLCYGLLRIVIAA